jgi:prepilin-type N-terminal cleavage/methylation domain-containing protein
MKCQGIRKIHLTYLRIRSQFVFKARANHFIQIHSDSRSSKSFPVMFSGVVDFLLGKEHNKTSKKMVFESGFTLIELMVSITILIVISGLGVASYNTFNHKQILDQSINTLRSDLSLAQNKALSGEKPAGWCSSDKLNGYKLSFFSGGICSNWGYVVKAVCSNGAVTSSTVKQICFQSPVSVTLGPDVFFRVVGQGVEMPDSPPNQTKVTVTLSAFNQSSSISVSQQGNIRLGTE